MGADPARDSVWSTGQDQMRVVKQRLLEMMPDLSVFLDVDDLLVCSHPVCKPFARPTLPCYAQHLCYA